MGYRYAGDFIEALKAFNFEKGGIMLRGGNIGIISFKSMKKFSMASMFVYLNHYIVLHVHQYEYAWRWKWIVDVCWLITR